MITAIVFGLLGLASCGAGAFLFRKGWKEGIRQRRIVAFHAVSEGRDAVISGWVLVVWGLVLLAGGAVALMAIVRQGW
jgi:uncharacterized membrane protein